VTLTAQNGPPAGLPLSSRKERAEADEKESYHTFKKTISRFAQCTKEKKGHGEVFEVPAQRDTGPTSKNKENKGDEKTPGKKLTRV